LPLLSIQALQALMTRISSVDVVSSLDGLHAVHQSMAQRTAAGAHVLTRVRGLLGDLRALREVVRAEEEEVYGLYDGTYEGEVGDSALAHKK
jgi:hypothetical protein